MRRKNKIPRSVVAALRSPFQQGILERQMHRQYFRRRLGLGGFQMPASAPVVRMLNASSALRLCPQWEKCRPTLDLFSPLRYGASVIYGYSADWRRTIY